LTAGPGVPGILRSAPAEPNRQAYRSNPQVFGRIDSACYRARPLASDNAMKHLKPAEALEFLQHHPQAVFVDCRSEMEYLFVGHPKGAQHVAWNDGPDWEVNPHFVGQVKKVASMNRPVILICRSGHRSVDAGLALEEAGFKEVYNVLDGFEGPLDDDHHRGTLGGWRKEGLPWEQL
jgi:rhodanese-related sulfurtransferase